MKNEIKMRRNMIFKTNVIDYEVQNQQIRDEVFNKMFLELTKTLSSKNLKSSFMRFYLEYQDVNSSKLKFAVDLIKPTNEYKEFLKKVLPICNEKIANNLNIKKIGISCERLIKDN